MTPNLNDVSKRIKYIRKNLGMTMEQFGSHIGNSPKSTIATWESGRNLPSQKKLQQIALIGETSIDWIKWGSLEEYISLLLIDLGFEAFINDFPETSHNIFTEIKKRYSDTFSLDSEYELLNLIIKNTFSKFYSSKFEKYLNDVLTKTINPMVTKFVERSHSISKDRFIIRFNSNFQDKIRNGEFKYGEETKIIDAAKQLLEEMDLSYRSHETYSSVEDFFFKISQNQIETEKFLFEISKKYNFPYEKDSFIAKFLTKNHNNFKNN